MGNLLKGLRRFNAGVEFDCSVVVNKHQNPQPSGLISAAERIPALRPLPIKNTSTNSQKKHDEFIRKYPFVKQVFYRENLNQDIGAYDYFYEHLRRKKYDGHVLFMNSSVRGPSQDGWLSKYRRLFEMEPDTGLCGISLNSHDTSREDDFPLFAPPVQSFFLYTSMAVLERVFPYGFLSQENNLSKENLILQGEIGIRTKVLQAGFGIRSSTIPDFFYKNGQEWMIPEGDIRYQRLYAHKTNKC